MKNYKKMFMGTLFALCAILVALCVAAAMGLGRAAKSASAAALPEVRNNGTAIQ